MKRRLKAEGKAAVDEDAIFAALARERRDVEEAGAKTAAARRALHRMARTERLAAEAGSVSSARPALRATELCPPGLDDDIFDASDVFDDIVPAKTGGGRP